MGNNSFSNLLDITCQIWWTTFGIVADILLYLEESDFDHGPDLGNDK
jgi:hypothetical protein